MGNNLFIQTVKHQEKNKISRGYIQKKQTLKRMGE